jgi:peroxiredoxin
MNGMKIYRILVLCLSIGTMLVSCTSNSTIIDGKVSLTNEYRPQVYLAFLNNHSNLICGSDRLIIDSARVDKDGYFHFELDSLPFDGGIYRLNISKKEKNIGGIVWIHGKHNSTYLFLNEGDHIHAVLGGKDLINDSKIAGNKECEMFSQYWQYFKNSQEEYRSDSLKKCIAQIKKEANQDRKEELAQWVNAEYRRIGKKWDEKLYQVMDTCTNVLMKMFVSTGLTDQSGEKCFQVRRVVEAQLLNQYPGSEYYSEYKLENERLMHLPIGGIAPNITMNTPEGKRISLHDVKARYLVLDFWASYCCPCIEENTNHLIPLYKEFKDKGLEIYSVSMDKKEKNWLKAIKKYKFDWIHVCDFKAYDSDDVKAYKFYGVPKVYLLDENKRIIGKGLRGNEMESLIRQKMKSIN